MRSPNDPGERIVTLTALSIAYRMTENRLLERIIPLMQRDTKRWLRQHPEHVHAFCDGYYERRDEAIALACAMTDEAMGDWDGLDINGVWTVLGARHESHLAHEQRAADAGFVTLDIDEMLERHFPPDEVARIKAESEAMIQAEKEAHAKGPDPDARMHYSFWLPDRLENYGEFDVGIPHRHRWRMERIGDYRYAGARFPVRDYTAFFDELRTEGVLSEEEHHNLMRWIAYESQPKGKREAENASRPIARSPMFLA